MHSITVVMASQNGNWKLPVTLAFMFAPMAKLAGRVIIVWPMIGTFMPTMLVMEVIISKLEKKVNRVNSGFLYEKPSNCAAYGFVGFIE